MFVAQLILVTLISICPVMLLMDGVSVYGVVAGLTAAGIAVMSVTIRPGEARFLVSTIRRAAVVTAVPALWIVVQLFPIKAVANPIWASAAAAIRYPLAGSISIDFGASIMALGLYLSAAGVALLAAAVGVDRQRAIWILFALVGATTLIALILVTQDTVGLGGLTTTAAEQAQAIDCAAIGAIVAAAAAIRTLERKDSRSAPQLNLTATFNWTFATCSAAFVTCALVVIISSTGAVMIATIYGVAAVIAVAGIRRLRWGSWGLAAVLVLGIGAAALLIASVPELRAQGIALAFVASSPATLISASQRVLSDTAWTGTGAGTFAAIMPIYRQINDPPMSTPPNAVVALSIELGWPMVVLIVTVTLGATFTLLKASLERGRDSFYPAAGAGGLITVLFLSFINPGILGTAAAVIFAAVIGLAFAQSKSRTQ